MSTSGRRIRTPKVELVVALLALSGCQCEPPVIDRPDGAVGDAGSDGGMMRSCRPAECAAPVTPFACAFSPPDAGPQPSCIAEACVHECPGGRSCEVLDGGRCLSCAGSVRCAPASCAMAHRCSFGVAGSTCTGLLDDGAALSVETQADCRAVISSDAGVIGAWFDLDTGEAVLNIPRLGGYCIARDLFTGVPRTQVYCPFCSFVAMGCD